MWWVIPQLIPRRNMTHRSALGSSQPPIQSLSRAPFPRVKWLGCEADHSNPSRGINEATHPLPSHAFMGWRRATLPFTVSIHFLPHLPFITGTVSDPASRNSAVPINFLCAVLSWWTDNGTQKVYACRLQTQVLFIICVDLSIESDWINLA
jgi:hypothetical protein